MNRELVRSYIILVRVGKPVGVREAQRILGFNSPGKAKRVLESLVRHGLAYRLENGDYVVYKKLPLELNSYIIVRSIILPRSIVYAVFSTTLALAYILYTKPLIEYTVIILLAISPLWIETLRLYLLLKHLKKPK